MRRAPQEGQKPRRLHENATMLLVAAVATAQAQKPVCQNAACEKSIDLGFDKLR
jgi:hypothetical protein